MWRGRSPTGLGNIRLALIAALLAAPALASDTAPTRILYATQSGDVAYDADELGGNPFASALIWALAHPAADQIAQLERRTGDYSGGYQIADGSGVPADLDLNPATGEAAVALVVVFADYGDPRGLVSLPGAEYDAKRVAAALDAAGYDTGMTVARDAQAYRKALREFAERSRSADRALLYTTGHGTEPARGEIYLLPPDFDDLENPPLSAAIPLSEAGNALKAQAVNLLLYGGCRERGLPGRS